MDAAVVLTGGDSQRRGAPEQLVECRTKRFTVEVRQRLKKIENVGDEGIELAVPSGRCSHWAQWEHAGKFNALSLAFLAR